MSEQYTANQQDLTKNQLGLIINSQTRMIEEMQFEISKLKKLIYKMSHSLELKDEELADVLLESIKICNEVEKYE